MGPADALGVFLRFQKTLRFYSSRARVVLDERENALELGALCALCGKK
jgi:hypothetical protein